MLSKFLSVEIQARGHSVEAAGFPLPLGPVEGMDQGEEPSEPGDAARRRGVVTRSADETPNDNAQVVQCIVFANVLPFQN